MDYMISNNAKLFDEILAVLDRHRDEPGVSETVENLRAARANYVNRSIDHMINCLALAMHYLLVNPPGEQLRDELRSAIDRFVSGIFAMGSRLAEIAGEYERSGGKLLSTEEILQEVSERR